MFIMRKKTYQMDVAQASSALQNIFAACDQAPNTIPFDKIILRQKLNTQIYIRLIIITLIVLLLTFLSPFVIVPTANFIEQLTAPQPIVLPNDFITDTSLSTTSEGL